MEYRKFWLQTASGSIFTLTDPSVKVFASNPEGFGYSMTNTTTRLGDVDYLTSKVPTMLDKSFEIIFYGDDIEEIYRNYQSFVRFINTDETLYLYYELGSIGTYRIVVTSSAIGKTEINPDDNCLTCALTLRTLTFWEDGQENTVTFSGSGTIFGTFEVLGETGTEASIRITGNTRNPHYRLLDMNGGGDGVTYGRGQFVGSFTEVYVNADPVNETIELKDTNGDPVANPYNYQNLTIGEDGVQLTFLSLRKGFNKVTFGQLDTQVSATVTIKYRNRYVSV